MKTVIFASAENVDFFLNPENWAKFTFDKFYCESTRPDNFQFTINENGFLVLPVNEALYPIAIIGVDYWKISLRFVPFNTSHALTTNHLYAIRDRTHISLYHSFDNAVDAFQKNLKTLTNPFGKRSFAEITMSEARIY